MGLRALFPGFGHLRARKCSKHLGEPLGPKVRMSRAQEAPSGHSWGERRISRGQWCTRGPVGNLLRPKVRISQTKGRISRAQWSTRGPVGGLLGPKLGFLEPKDVFLGPHGVLEAQWGAYLGQKYPKVRISRVLRVQTTHFGLPGPKVRQKHVFLKPNDVFLGPSGILEAQWGPT